MHHFLKLAVLGFVYTASAFDLEDYATTYRATRDAYLKAANELKLATGPYKAARDAYVAATATYTKSLYERRRLGFIGGDGVGDGVGGPRGHRVTGWLVGDAPGMLPLEDARASASSCFFPRRDGEYRRLGFLGGDGINAGQWVRPGTSSVPDGHRDTRNPDWYRFGIGSNQMYNSRFGHSKHSCNTNILRSGAKRCAPKPVDLNVIDDPEMCHGVEKVIMYTACQISQVLHMENPKVWRKIVRGVIGKLHNPGLDIGEINGGAAGASSWGRRLWMWKLNKCPQPNFHNQPGVTSRDQFAYKIPGEETCKQRVKSLNELTNKLREDAVDFSIQKHDEQGADCLTQMVKIDQILLEASRGDAALRYAISAGLDNRLDVPSKAPFFYNDVHWNPDNKNSEGTYQESN